MTYRLTALFLAVLAGFAFVLMTVALVAGAIPTNDDDETLREQAAARAAEANPSGPILSQRAVVDSSALITAPLFAGVDDDAVFAQAIDPVTADSTPLFDGIEVWGAAFDWQDEIVYIITGSSLAAWPLSGSPTDLGIIYGLDGGVTTTLTFVSAAYVDGMLYSTRNIATGAFPEGGYTIDPVTLQATLAFTYSIGANAADIGGLAAHPLTGQLYGLNDDTDLQGLVAIDLDGTVTLVAPYPTGQVDLDGLAISKDGRAFLIPDEPGSIYVYDFNTLTYTLPITNPWTTAEVFSGGAWVEEMIPGITITKTVGLDPDLCATETETAVAYGDEVTYCYEVTNIGDVTLNRHDLEDDKLGPILSNFPFTLVPGASAFLTQTTAITQTTINTATWTAYNEGPTDVISATAQALVTLIEPSLVLTKTVGLEPDACGTADELTLAQAGDVTYCYEVTNTGTLTLTTHNLVDSELGQLLTDFEFDLAPGASVFITVTATISATTVNTATWSAYTTVPEDGTEATDSATVIISGSEDPAIVVSPDALTATVMTGASLSVPLTISNTGAAPLEWTITEAMPTCVAPAALSWADADPPAGTTDPGASTVVSVMFDATNLGPGNLVGALCVASNDPAMPVVEVPLALTVTEPVSVSLYLPVISGSPNDTQ